MVSPVISPTLPLAKTKTVFGTVCGEITRLDCTSFRLILYFISYILIAKINVALQLTKL